MGEADPPVKGRLDEIEDRIDSLLAEWTNTLFNTVTDPTLEEQKQYLKPTAAPGNRGIYQNQDFAGKD